MQAVLMNSSTKTKIWGKPQGGALPIITHTLGEGRGLTWSRAGQRKTTQESGNTTMSDGEANHSITECAIPFQANFQCPHQHWFSLW